MSTEICSARLSNASGSLLISYCDQLLLFRSINKNFGIRLPPLSGNIVMVAETLPDIFLYNKTNGALISHIYFCQ
jgi:hypothetical protein